MRKMIIDCLSTCYRAFEEVVPFDSAYAYKITYPVRETMIYSQTFLKYKIRTIFLSPTQYVPVIALFII